jgi:ATP-GRASP peptide maturase of grasp-with-spasm system
MILILSKEVDHTTDKVIDWLNYYKIPFLRVNREDPINRFKVELKKDSVDFEIHFDSKKLSFSEVNSYWYRRNALNFGIIKKASNKFEEFISTEKIVLKAFIEKLISKKDGIGTYIKNKDVNKLESLLIASQVGFNIPATTVTNEKTNILGKANKYIIKPISEVITFRKNKNIYISYTAELDDSKLTQCENFVCPTLMQNKILKKYELRVFYLKGKCYSMAIFSQNDNKTSIDYRNYNKDKPNRTIPFKLPLHIEKKIVILMNRLGFDTGSIDFIVDVNQTFYFLEVNPVGQFGMVSNPCNYELHKIIACELKNTNNETIK